MKKLLNEIISLYRNILVEYAVGKKLIPVSYYNGQYSTGYLVSDEEWEDEMYNERSYIEYYASSYKDAVEFMCHKNGNTHHDCFGLISTREAKFTFLHFVRGKVAEMLYNYGFRVDSIMWYLYNYKTESVSSVKSWGRYGFDIDRYNDLKSCRIAFIEYCSRVKNEINYYANVKTRYSRMKEYYENKELNELIDKYYKLGGDSVIKVNDFENHLGETVGWTEYDLNNKIVSGYKVTCWNSSWLGLGNCHCNSHEPGYSFEHLLTVDNVKMLIKMQEEKNEYYKEIDNLPKGRWVISKFETWNGEHIDDYLEISEEGAFRHTVNCYNSQDFGGTCRCVSHQTWSSKQISIEETKRLLEMINKNSSGSF